MDSQRVEGKPLDIFAGGMLMWELMEGAPPAASLRDQAVLAELVRAARRCGLLHTALLAVDSSSRPKCNCGCARPQLLSGTA